MYLLNAQERTVCFFWYNDSLSYEGLHKVTFLAGKASVKFMLWLSDETIQRYHFWPKQRNRSRVIHFTYSAGVTVWQIQCLKHPLKNFGGENNLCKNAGVLWTRQCGQRRGPHGGWERTSPKPHFLILSDQEKEHNLCLPGGRRPHRSWDCASILSSHASRKREATPQWTPPNQNSLTDSREPQVWELCMLRSSANTL